MYATHSGIDLALEVTTMLYRLLGESFSQAGFSFTQALRKLEWEKSIPKGFLEIRAASPIFGSANNALCRSGGVKMDMMTWFDKLFWHIWQTFN